MKGVNPLHNRENDYSFSTDFSQEDKERQWADREALISQKAANQSYINRGKAPLLSSEVRNAPSFLFQTPLGTPFNEISVEKNLETQGRFIRENPQGEEDKPIRPFQSRQNSSPPPRITRQVNQMMDYLDSPVRLSAEGHAQENRTGANRFIQRWYYEEVKLSMNKISLVGLVVGLMFLGALFFVVGFLAAVATLKPASREDQVPSVNYGRFFSKMAGDAVAKRPLSLIRDIEEMPAIVPQSLQPFARYGTPSHPHHEQQHPYQKNPFDVSVNTQRTMSPANELPRLQTYEPSRGYSQQNLSQGGQRGYGAVYPHPAQRYAPVQPPVQQLPQQGEGVNPQAFYQGEGQQQPGSQGNRPPAAYAGSYYRPLPVQAIAAEPSIPYPSSSQQYFHQPRAGQPVYQQPRVYQPVTVPQASMPLRPQGQSYTLPQSSSYPGSSQEFPRQPLAPAPAYYR